MRNASELFHRVFVRPFIANVSKSTHTHTYTHSRCWTSTVWFIGERLSPNIRNHFIYFEFEFVLTVSIGCSQPASHGNDSDSVWSHDIVNGSRVKYLYVGMCYHLSIAWHETQIRTGNPLRVCLCVYLCPYIQIRTVWFVQLCFAQVRSRHVQQKNKDRTRSAQSDRSNSVGKLRAFFPLMCTMYLSSVMLNYRWNQHAHMHMHTHTHWQTDIKKDRQTDRQAYVSSSCAQIRTRSTCTSEWFVYFPCQ